MPSTFSNQESVNDSIFTTYNPIFSDPAFFSQIPSEKFNHGGCFDDQKWFLIIGSSLVVIFFSLFVVLTCKVWFVCFGENDSNKEENISWLSEAKDWAGQLISAQSTVGQLLVVLVFLFSIFSLIIYLIDTESGCRGWLSEKTQQADLAFNIFFLVYFLIRFAASSEKLLFLFEMYSIVDFLTIPPSFVLFYFNTNWLGLRFTRALRLMSIPDVLQYLNLLKTSTSIRLCQLTSTFLSVWLTAAGVVHLVENSGDPFKDGLKVKSKSYWECIYFTLVTMSTVGYGDVCCETSLGRLFMVFFILGALAMFASFIPEMMEMFSSRSKYNGEYVSLPGKRHVVLCGHITHDSVSSFLADFLHQDRLHAGVQVVLLHRKEPDLELGGVLKRQMTQVHFFKGSVMNSADLTRVKVRKADACMILANKYSRDPDAEDASNIMRVVSVKNSCAHVRVLVQLMQYHNKAHLLNVASWDIRRGDEVICIAELKLASIGQSCMAPGFSTLLANLFTMRSYKPFGEKRELWQELYMRGTSMEMYTSFFSTALHSLTFPQAALVCFEKLGLLLIGVESGGVRINPSDDVFIRSDTQGFFVAESAEDVKRVLYYCVACHGRDPDIATIKRCPCHIEHRKKGVLAERSKSRFFSFAKLPFLRFKRRQMSGIQSKVVSYDLEAPGSFYDYQEGFNLNLTHHHRIHLPPQYKQIVKKDHHHNVPYNDHIRECFIKQPASTVHELKLFPNQYTCPNRQYYNGVCSHARQDSFQVYGQNNETHHNCTIDCRKSVYRSPYDRRALRELSAEPSYDYTGMFYWTSPLPFNSCLMTKEEASMKAFEDHVVVCVFAGQGSAEVGLRSLVMPLRASNLLTLRDVVLVGDPMFVKKEWSSLCNFPRIFMLEGSPLDRATLRAVSVEKCSMCVIIASRNMHEDDLNLVDKEVILCSLNIKAMSFQMNTCSKGSKSGHDIPMITELGNDTNVQFLDQDDDDDPNTELYMTQPFACGTAFAVSVLDSLMSTTFFNANALTLIRTLITGGDTAPLERILAEGVGMTGGHLVPHKNRSRVTQIPLWHKPFYEIYQRNIEYSYLFSQAMQCHGILCIGLYRLKDTKGGGKRYVITNPPGNFPLLLSDKVFCLRPFDTED